MTSYFECNAHHVRPVWRADGEGERLRRAQVGAAFSLVGHFTVAADPGQVVMPTGTGKTAAMTLIPYLAPIRRALVVAPSRLVRDQIAEEFRTLARLRATQTAPTQMPKPRVEVVRHRLGTPGDWSRLADFDVVLGTPMCLSSVLEGVAVPPPDLFDLILLDEAHHTPARTWESILSQFPGARAGLFTATPYRRDLRALPGSICFSYSLHDAITDGVYEPVTFRPVDVGTGDDSDARLAEEARRRLDDPVHREAGSQLLVRAGRIATARHLVEVYRQVDLEIEVVDSQQSLRHIRSVLARLRCGELRGVATVGILGEGFDLPSLKVAAYHDRHRSLPATLQFIGRVARAQPNRPAPAELLAVKQDVQDETRALYQEDASWAELLPALADAAVAEERDRRRYVQGFTPPPPDTFSLHAVAPARQAEILELDAADGPPDLHASIEALGDGAVWWSSTDESGDLLAIVTQRRSRPAWMRADTLDTIDHDLHLVVHEPSHRLLFVSTTSPATRRQLLAAVGAPTARPIPPEDLNRLLHSIHVLSYSSVGLRSARAPGLKQPSYKTVAGSGVHQAVLPSEALAFGVGHLIGRYRDASGAIEGIGVAVARGKVWSPGAQTLLAYRTWCKWVAELLHASITAGHSAPLLEVPMPRRLHAFPDHPVAVLLHQRLLDGTYAVLVNGSDPVELLLLELVATRTSDYDCTLTLSHEGSQLGQVQMLAAGGVQPIGDDLPVVNRSTGELHSLAAVLDTFPPVTYFADGSSAAGTTLFVPRANLPPVPTDAVASIDWTGVDIRAEARVRDATQQTIQQRAVDWLAQTSPQAIVIRDDGAGEIADLIVVDPVDTETARLSLVHCKYSSEDAPGHRVADLYEVVGQAVRSAQWTAAGRIWPELSRRLDNRASTQVMHGDADTLSKLLEDWCDSPPAVECTIGIVQPGLRISGVQSSRNCNTILVLCHDWVATQGAKLRIIGA